MIVSITVIRTESTAQEFFFYQNEILNAENPRADRPDKGQPPPRRALGAPHSLVVGQGDQADC
ncbi:hypothetical protein [Azospirillum oryzae]|uniref:hypothetical protein n=1 Tax=Azospirillum oryzae TaxID=286727 RepID=UPI0011781BFC|nr:hypothetical protein [Azospirillum oryzae]